MKKEIFEIAQGYLQRAESIRKKKDKLFRVAEAVLRKEGENNVQELAQLLIELTEKEGGKDVVWCIVNQTLFALDSAEREAMSNFEQL